MAGIFYFSSRPNPLGFLPLSRNAIDVDKFAHIGEYTGLVIMLHRALSNSRGGDWEKGREGESVTRKRSSPLLVPLRRPELGEGFLCLLFAVLDELHQELTPGRGFELADIGYDLVGIMAALGLIWVRERGGGKAENEHLDSRPGLATRLAGST